LPRSGTEPRSTISQLSMARLTSSRQYLPLFHEPLETGVRAQSRFTLCASFHHMVNASWFWGVVFLEWANEACVGPGGRESRPWPPSGVLARTQRVE